MHVTARWALAALLLAGCDRFAPPEVDYRPEQAGTVDHALCLLGFRGVPLRRLSTGHHVVALTLNGRPANFVVDTGANMTVIHAGFADEYGVVPGAGAPPAAIGISGPLEARQSSVESLEIGGVRIRQRRIVVAGIAQVTESLGRYTNSEIHGILGQDVMGEHRAVIDVARAILHLVETDRDPAPVPAELCLAAADESGAGNRSAAK